jgi:hypothetical protein
VEIVLDPPMRTRGGEDRGRAEFLFGISNLVIAAGRDDDAAGGILRIGAEFDS